MCDPQLSRTPNSPLWAFITVEDLLAASGQILVATTAVHLTNTRVAADPTVPRRVGTASDGGVRRTFSVEVLHRSYWSFGRTESRSANFWILPVAVFGSGPNTIRFGAVLGESGSSHAR